MVELYITVRDPIHVKWCKDKDENGNVIPWTYDVSIEHEDFMIYEDGAPYCRGFVFKVVSE